MVHTENNEKKKDNKEVKKKYSRRGIFISNVFYQKRDTKRNDKSRYIKVFEKKLKNEFKRKEVNEEEKKKKAMETKKSDGEHETREG